ncbi:MAG TPA: MFS transporter, partial [Gammaproteobacteria bacterium]
MSTTTTEARATPAESDKLLDSPAYKGYVLVLLVLGYIFNVIDRGVLGVLVEPIKAELQISDTAMGLLTGLAFAVFYSVMGVPIARLADRWSRVNVLALAITLWSLATAACGAAWNYLSLFVARSLTGVGEAGGSPPSHSLISDYFPISQRATALAIYAMSVPIGTAIGNFTSGWSNVYLGWRWTFALVGLPGLLVALLVWLTLKEPPRGYSDGPGAKQRAT